jgi:hypothetical protein
MRVLAVAKRALDVLFALPVEGSLQHAKW